MSHAGLLLVALLLDGALGEPRWLWARWPHPAVLMGRAVAWADRRFNHGDGRLVAGALSVGGLVAVAGLAGWIIAHLPGGALWQVLLAAILLAHRSLVDHVRRVARALRLSTGDARIEVARIVGRDTRALDDAAIARAAIESAAENFSDGVVAPAFWFLLAGLPGMLICKAVNTADSMIGYRNDRYEAFGKAAARLDDLLNWLPARLSAGLIALAHPRPGIIATIRRDARLHRSPNAGWPEAAMAAALGVALAGPRAYDGQMRDFAWVNPAGRQAATAGDVERAIAVLWRAWALLVAFAALIAIA